ncbi:hypothetical protein EYF80_010616 [Liparis tanakae]|uniref:Uncharacterized protein n=1 Tax=Liparis tanakae TaxID=230148 RepID=A0A4Z2IN78_9TELE|nr:hypothetical protein EYF80_010616 [Liparis tanakae]
MSGCAGLVDSAGSLGRPRGPRGTRCKLSQRHRGLRDETEMQLGNEEEEEEEEEKEEEEEEEEEEG